MAMPKIELRLQMFRGDWDQIWSQQRLLWAMEGLCRINQTHLRQMDAFKARGLVERGYPPLYRSGMHYETEKGTEIWPDIPSMLSGVMGKGIYPGPWGDCEDFACYRVAELRELPWHYRRKAKWAKGGYEHADPRFPQSTTPDMASGVAAWVDHMATEPVVPSPVNNETPAGTAADKKNETAAYWKGWEKVKGGIAAKPFAKWRRGPQGNYHYHALTMLPDGRLEDPSLVLGMGREAEFSDTGMAEKLRKGEAPVIIQFAKIPDVMVVDPESPSGYAGGKAKQLDKAIVDKIKAGQAPEGVDASLGPGELAAMMSNEIALSQGEFDIDSLIGWNRAEGRFVPKDENQETRRLLGYSNH
jgi:hypothetical protein